MRRTHETTMSTEGAARLLGWSRDRVRRHAAAGLLEGYPAALHYTDDRPRKTAARHLRITLRSVLAYMAQQAKARGG
jgi:hypothetical protein